MAEYKTYLASNILSEDKVVTYRLLSRALKVHVNAAKEMLFDFHQHQNAKKPGTIHATYLLSGTKKPEDPIGLNGGAKKDGEDYNMQSSPFMSSSMPQPEDRTGESSVLSITLVREEDLEEVRSQYEHISSIHIYSLGPHPLKDLQVLSDVTRELQLLTANEDPLELAPTYGTIINKNVKRRAARRPLPPAEAPAPPKAAAAAPKPKPEPKEIPKPQPSTANDFFGKSKQKSKPAAETGPNNPSNKESTPAPGPATLKKETSNIFKSFAKAKPKLKREGTDSEVAPEVEDSPMRDIDDDDEEETYVPPPQKSKEIVDSDRKARKEREEKLRRMMEDDDDEEEAVVTPKAEVKKEESVEPVKEEMEKSAVSGVRRRGRRRVMKKKTVKDAEGYLVTKEEPVWESFSEDEATPPNPKVQAPSAAKSKKLAAKAGQGNIMSFFGKK